MRKILALTVAAIAATALAGGAAVAGESKKSPPVALEGEVSNKGEKSVKKGKVTIDEGDFFYRGTFIKAKQGSKVAVRLRNKGDAPHTFTIPSLGIDRELTAGKSATVEVTLPTDGALAFYCRFHGAPPSGGQGMQGAFFSKKGEALSTGAGAAPASSAPTDTTGAAPTTSAPATTASGGGGYGY
jgi:plastocyanin